MSIVGGGIIGLTVGALQTQFGFISDISLLRFTMMGALAGFGGSMVSRKSRDVRAFGFWESLTYLRSTLCWERPSNRLNMIQKREKFCSIAHQRSRRRLFKSTSRIRKSCQASTFSATIKSTSSRPPLSLSCLDTSVLSVCDQPSVHRRFFSAFRYIV